VKRENWYRAVHNTIVRIRGSRGIEQRTRSEKQIKEQAQQYRSLLEQIQDSLPDTPTEEVGLHLFNSLQNIEVSCLRYINEAESEDTNKIFLQNHQDTIVTFCSIAQYIIEEKKSPDIEFVDELDEDEKQQAKQDYRDWDDGSLYDEEMDENIQKFLELAREQ
jgi:sugar-specific transcriptional regulator TrmB